MVVIVPVRNEAEAIAATLAALAAQQGIDKVAHEVLVLANNCDDGSASIARRSAREHAALAIHVAEIELAPPEAHIGTVRKLLMDAACDRLERAGASAGIIASTDGDTTVAPDWLAMISREFAAGADAVGGRIELDSRSPLDPATLRRHRADTAYRLALAKLEHLIDPDPGDPWPRHHQHFGASLAVSRAAYRQVGGVPAVRFLEDEALVGALRRADLRVRHSPKVRVRTSSRRDGRVEVGLSWQLRQWAGEPALAAITVDDVERQAAQFRARKLLRAAWQARDHALLRQACAEVAACFRLSPDGVEQHARGAARFGALWDALRLFGARDPAPAMPVQQAMTRLRHLIAAHGGASASRASTSSR